MSIYPSFLFIIHPIFYPLLSSVFAESDWSLWKMLSEDWSSPKGQFKYHTVNIPYFSQSTNGKQVASEHFIDTVIYLYSGKDRTKSLA